MRTVQRVMAIAVVVILGSCGGDNASTSTKPATTSPKATKTTATTPAVSPQRKAADRAHAERAVSKITDFSPGWRSVDSDEDSGGECADSDDFSPTGKADSAFVKGDARVESSARVFSSVGQARKAFADFTSKKTRDCSQRRATDQIKKTSEVKSGKVKLEDVSVGELSIARYGEQSAGLQLVMTLSQSEPIAYSTDLIVDVIFVRQDRALLTTFFVEEDNSDTELQDKLLRAATGRLAP
jgi:hypothetical protein